MRFTYSPLILALVAALVDAAEEDIGGNDMMPLQPNDIVTVTFFSAGTDPNDCADTKPDQVTNFDLCCACMTITDTHGVPTGLANFALLEEGTRFEWNSFPRDTSCGAEAAGLQLRKFAGAECQVQTDGQPYLTRGLRPFCDVVEEDVDVDGGEEGDVEEIESEEPKSEPEPETSCANSMMAFYGLLGPASEDVSCSHLQWTLSSISFLTTDAERSFADSYSLAPREVSGDPWGVSSSTGTPQEARLDQGYGGQSPVPCPWMPTPTSTRYPTPESETQRDEAWETGPSDHGQYWRKVRQGSSGGVYSRAESSADLDSASSEAVDPAINDLFDLEVERRSTLRNYMARGTPPFET
ncbi:hypothetical protein THAOC_08632 [Thalassiosira oceanica]|uniref:Uncharacterized protein n=1 Tax=Thalassiosira oceanica TaxID=159749 RepID=K0T9D4_THAOC|nr:hypothetical protein THAOC_08632 [Thalassiosira oceanica]|eukprot:EJK70046.1 hypothetical protein THAOC_08632 [Thalassiosira oceanica]